MVATDRESLFELRAGVRIRYRRSEAPPPYTYAITVEIEEAEDAWVTVQLWDNADDVNEHHLHEYTRQDGKQEPVIRKFRSVNEAMAVANVEARTEIQKIMRRWRES